MRAPVFSQRSNPVAPQQEGWIASELTLLAMTAEFKHLAHELLRPAITSRTRQRRVHHSPPFVTIAIRPSQWDGMAREVAQISVKRKCVFHLALGDPNHVDRSCNFRSFARKQFSLVENAHTKSTTHDSPVGAEASPIRLRTRDQALRLSPTDRQRSGPASRPHGLRALGPKISKTTPCKVARRSLGLRDPAKDILTRRANHWQACSPRHWNFHRSHRLQSFLLSFPWSERR